MKQSFNWFSTAMGLIYFWFSLLGAGGMATAQERGVADQYTIQILNGIWIPITGPAKPVSTVGGVPMVCNSKNSCQFKIDTPILGPDPAGGVTKQYTIYYDCHDGNRKVNYRPLVAQGSDYDILSLSCAAADLKDKKVIYIEDGTWAPMSGPAAPESTVGLILRQCDNNSTCDFVVNYPLLGKDPSPGTTKLYSLHYGCYQRDRRLNQVPLLVQAYDYQKLAISCLDY
jgi:hypothetical protein